MRRSIRLQVLVAFLLLLPFPLISQVLPECSNGVDDDGDGLVDYPADPSCLQPDGAREGGASDLGVVDQAFVDGGFDLSPLPREDLAGADLTGQVSGPSWGAGVLPAPGGQSPPQSRGCALATSRGNGLNAVFAGALILLLYRGRRRGT